MDPKRPVKGDLDSAQEIWTRFYEARYLSEARAYPQGSKCPTCDSSKECNNYFCVLCKVGGLCPITFRDDGEHKTHPWIQVRNYHKKPSVVENDLGCFINLECLVYVQKHLLNGRDHLCLRSSNTLEPRNADESRDDGASGSRCVKKGKPERCLSCKVFLRGSQNSKESFMVCSLQCLVQVAAENPKWNLLHMNDDKLHPKSHPMLAIEKYRLTPEDPNAKNLVYLALLFNSKPPEGPIAVGPPPIAVEAPPMVVPDAAADSPTDDAVQSLPEPMAVGMPPIAVEATPMAVLAAVANPTIDDAVQAPPATMTMVLGPMATAVPERHIARRGHAGRMYVGLATLIEVLKACGDWDKYLGSSGRD